MRLAFINRDKLQSLGRPLIDELDSLYARIRAGWNRQHKADGSHGHVTSTTISTGRLVFSGIATDTLNAASVDNYAPDIEDAGILRLDSALAEVTITGLKVPQDADGNVLDGRVLFIENKSSAGTVIVLSDRDDRSFPRNYIHIPRGPNPSNATNYYYLHPNTITALVYDAGRALWVIESQSNENTIGFTTFSSNQDDLQVSGSYRTLRTWRLAPDAQGLTVSGLLATLIPATERKILVNDGAFTVALLHANTGSAAANRIYCPGGVRYMLNPRESVEIMRIEGGGWRIIEKADQWIDVAYDAGNFTATGGTTPTWTVDEADQVTFCYQIDGNMMTVAFTINSTSVSGGPTALRIAIPAGRVSARQIVTTVGRAHDASTVSDAAWCRVLVGATHIELFKNGSVGAWSAATNTTLVQGQITFMVRDDCASIVENHVDVAHGDQQHLDSEHLDSHSDVSFSDVHQDQSHQDSSHADLHSDESHLDQEFQDSPHADEPHQDQEFQDSHEDTPHADDPGEHLDNPHTDEHEDHDDGVFPENFHEDEHFDSPHTDHQDGFVDSPHEDDHSDQPFQDEGHDDQPHQDQEFQDVSHEDSHADSGHSDVQFQDHSDVVPHEDEHSDQAAQNQSHGDAQHQDAGLACSPTHTDQ